jgi:protein phosphatase
VDNLERKPFVVSAAAFTDAGQVRKNNQDYIAYHIPKEASVSDGYGALFLVCDGVGGHSAGEVASEHAGRRILNDYYQAPATQPAVTRLVAAIEQANADILQENGEEPDARRMTTTVVAAVIEGSRLNLAHVGDSRAYLIRAGRISQLTTDHSWVAEMVRAGDLTPEEAQHHPWRNRITRSLGLKDHVVVDSQVFEATQGDVVVLCSDGLTRHVADAEISETAARQPAYVAAQTLLKLAKARGGSDNISVIVAQLLSPEAAQASAGQGTAQSAAPRVPTGSRKVSFWLPLALAAGLLLLAVIAAVVYTQTDLLRRPPASTPTVAPVVAPTTGSASATPADASAPPAVPLETPTSASTAPAAVATSTSRWTSTPSATLAPSATPTQTATGVPPATVDAGGASTPLPRATSLMTYVPTPAHTVPATATTPPIALPTPKPTKDNPTIAPPKKPTP